MNSTKVIKLDSVTKVYKDGDRTVTALDNVSLSIEQGESVAIEGPSGSGKSTLLQILGALDEPTSGSVNIFGVEPFQLNDKELSKFRNETIGFVFQFFNLLPYYSALENVMVPLLLGGVSETDAREKAKTVLDELGLSDRLNHRPSQLSGGQMQRVAIARALGTEPKLILADEPTGNLDKENKAIIADLLASVSKKGITLIVVTHDQLLSERFGRKLRIDGGRLLQPSNEKVKDES